MKRRWLQHAAIMLASFGSISCDTTAPGEAPATHAAVLSGTAAEDVIREVRDAWLAAHNSGNAHALAGHFAEDAAILPSGAPTALGRTAIEQYLAADFATGIGVVSILSSEVRVAGSLAVERADYEVRSATDPDRPPRRGKYVIAYQKGADGIWRIQWDIWNADG